MTASSPAIKRLLVFTFVIGVFGSTAELLLLGHIEGWEQMIPVALLALSVVVLIVHALKCTWATSAVFLMTMWLFIISGAVGVALHFQGNAEFEREMYPEMKGLELAQKTMTGATPVLAPGTMALLGLVGLAYLRVTDHVRAN